MLGAIAPPPPSSTLMSAELFVSLLSLAVVNNIIPVMLPSSVMSLALVDLYQSWWVFVLFRESFMKDNHILMWWPLSLARKLHNTPLGLCPKEVCTAWAKCSDCWWEEGNNLNLMWIGTPRPSYHTLKYSAVVLKTMSKYLQVMCASVLFHDV